jgi:predicted DCC family thiol-disulfide oxidoreductase YuxK
MAARRRPRAYIPAMPRQAPQAASAVALEAYYDGACPICSREVAALRRLDRGGRIRFTDLAAPGFDASAVGIPWADLMDRIHARLPDGKVVEGVEVFRRIYAALGYGWLVAPTRLPGVRQLLDLAYRTFARNRMRLTGRCDEAGCRAHAPR